MVVLSIEVKKKKFKKCTCNYLYSLEITHNFLYNNTIHPVTCES